MCQLHYTNEHDAMWHQQMYIFVRMYVYSSMYMFVREMSAQILSVYATTYTDNNSSCQGNYNDEQKNNHEESFVTL